MRRLVMALTVAVLGATLVSLVVEMPPFGGRSNPAFNIVFERYTREALQDTGAPNIVTAIVLDYRGFDTMGETTVLFTAILAAVLALSARPRSHSRSRSETSG